MGKQNKQKGLFSLALALMGILDPARQQVRGSPLWSVM